MFKLLILFVLVSCGEPGAEGERCRGAEEAQMKCQIDYVERYQILLIPEHIKRQCESFYPQAGCYLDSNKRYFW